MLFHFLHELQREPYFLPLAASLAALVVSRVFGDRRPF
jgi:hypothetical protein